MPWGGSSIQTGWLCVIVHHGHLCQLRVQEIVTMLYQIIQIPTLSSSLDKRRENFSKRIKWEGYWPRQDAGLQPMTFLTHSYARRFTLTRSKNQGEAKKMFLVLWCAQCHVNARTGLTLHPQAHNRAYNMVTANYRPFLIPDFASQFGSFSKLSK